MFLFIAVPVTIDSASIDWTIPAVEVVVESTATYNGNPIEIGEGVTLTMTDGFTVTMGQHEAEVALSEPTPSSSSSSSVEGWDGPTYNGEPCLDCQTAADAVCIWTGDGYAETGFYEASVLGITPVDLSLCQ